jgi:hypothetical protein
MANSTIPQYSFEASVGPFWQFPANVADAIMPGDLLYFDTGSNTARPLIDATNHSAQFCGIAVGEYPPSSNIDNGITSSPAFISVAIGGVHKGQFDTNGDSFTPGCNIYAGADQRHITTTQPGSAPVIGYYWDFSTLTITGTGAEQPQWRPVMQWPSVNLTAQ